MDQLLSTHNVEIIKYPNKHLHSAAITVMFMRGADACGKDAGLAHLTEHMFFRACGSMSQAELYRETESSGVDLNATTGNRDIRFEIFCPPEKVGKAAEILCGMLRGAWTEERLEREKMVVRAEIQEQGNSHVYKLKKKLLNAASAASILGTDSSVARLTLKKVETFRADMLASKKYIIAAGNFDDEALRPLIEFLDAYPAREEEQPFSAPAFKDLTFVDSRYNTVEISFVFERGESVHEQLQLLTAVLFAYPGAPALEILRERNGYIYSIDSDIYYAGEQGLLNIFFEVAEQDYILPAFGALVDLLCDIERVVDDARLAQTRPLFMNEFDYMYDDDREIVDQCANTLAHIRTAFDIEKKREIYSRITVRDLVATGRRLFAAKKCVEIKCYTPASLRKRRGEFTALLNKLNDLTKSLD